MNQSLEAVRKRGKTCAGELRLVLILHLIGWKSGVSFKPIVKRSNEKQSRCKIRVVFIQCRKVTGSASSTLHNWLTKLAPLFHPIRIKTKTNRISLALVFPRFASAYVITSSFDWLIGLPTSLWLASVIALVLGLRHSAENSNEKLS